VTDRRQMVGMGPLLMLRCDRIPVVLTWLHQPLKALRSERGLLMYTSAETAAEKTSCGQGGLVEAAGVEPASENVTGQETTCLFAFMP